MIANAVWLAVLLSGSFFACAIFNRRFEEIFPVTCLAVIFTLFVIGLCGYLKYSAIIFLTVSVILYGAAVLIILRKQVSFVSFLSKFFTPAFSLLCVYFLLLNVLDFNLLATGSDEFSHWMDSIQVMVHLDDFITNPASNSLYQSYPPAMTLFQYLFQKIYLLFNPGSSFSEWRMYLAFQIFSLSMLFPFLRDLSFKRPLSLFLVGILVFIIPLPFFSDFHYSIYIDPVIGILAGCGLAMPLVRKHKDLLYSLHISLICSILLLSKDAGLYFSCFVMLLNVVIVAIDPNSNKLTNKKDFHIHLVYALLPVAFVLFSKFAWNYMIEINKSNISFGNKISLIDYTRMFFLNNDDSYKQTVVDTFKDTFYSMPFYIGSTNITIRYFDLLCICAFALYYCCRKYNQAQPCRKRIVLALGSITIAQLVIYIYCLGATYVYNFEKHEALAMASYQRYSNIAYLAVWIVIFVILLRHFLENIAVQNRNHVLIGLTLCVFLLSPMKNVSDFLSRDVVRDSYYFRQQYTDITDQISEFCTDSDRIYFIAQHTDGYDFRGVKFAVYPNHITNTDGWSLGKPYSETDRWTKNLTPEQWFDMLEREYDYVALYRVDDNFISAYSTLFDNAAIITNNSLYKVNKEKDILVKCE